MTGRFATRPVTVALLAFLVCCAALAAPPTPLVPPSSLSANGVSTSQIRLAWNDPNSSESGYQLERSPDGVNGFAQVASLAKNVTVYTNSGLSAGTTYYYRVRAKGKGTTMGGYSLVASGTTVAPPPSPTPTPTAPPPPPTATPTAAPPPPTATATPVPPPPTATPTPVPIPAAASNLTATAASSSQINLGWTDNSSNETGFKVLRSLAATGPWTEIASTAATTYASAGLSSATTYFYKVCAYNGSGVAPDSNVANATTLASLPNAPSGLTASAVSSSQINLSWTDGSTNESGFKVERSTATSGWAQIGTTGANVASYASTGLGAGTAYSYRVRAYNGAGDSGYSNTASATTTGGSTGSSWSKRHGDTVDDRGQAVAVDGSGNVVLVGHLDGASDLGSGMVSSYVHPAMGATVDVVVAEYSSSGAHLWSRVIGSDGTEEGKGVATDSSGNVIVTGYQGSYAVDYGGGVQYLRAGTDAFVAKYSSAGSWVWSKTVGGGGYDGANAVAADGAGNVLLTGYFGSSTQPADFGGGGFMSAGLTDVFVVKYSATGSHVWSRRLGGTGSDIGLAIGADASGNVFVAGTFEGTVDFGGGPLTSAGLRDAFLVKYNSLGQYVWAKRFGSTGDDVINALAFDSASDLVLSGKFQASVGFGGPLLTSAGGDDAFLAKLDGLTGNHVWSKRVGGTGNDISTGVAVDGSDNVVLAGYYMGSVDFGGGALQSLGIDVFVARYNSAGTHLSSRRFGSADTQICDGVAAAGNGDVTVTGFFNGTIDFGTGAMTSAGAYDGFTAKVAP